MTAVRAPASAPSHVAPHRVSARCRTVLMYAQDHKGMGHISRALTIARHVLPPHPTAVAYIATESPIASNFVLPDRCDYIKLPGRVVPAAVAETPEDQAASKERFVRIRSALLRDAALGLAPDL